MIVYGRNPVREALRGQRAVRQVWATKNAAREPWLEGVGPLVTGADALEQLCGSSSHQGVCAEAGAYPYADADALIRGDRGLILALDQVQDPQNLGSICRTAECAGVAGIVIPERRAAEVTPAVCKASAGAVEHLNIARVRNLADFLVAAKEQGRWVYGADAREMSRTARCPTGTTGARARVRGPRPPAAGRGTVRRGARDPDAGPDRVAERQRRRRGPALWGEAGGWLRGGRGGVGDIGVGVRARAAPGGSRRARALRTPRGGIGAPARARRPLRRRARPRPLRRRGDRPARSAARAVHARTRDACGAAPIVRGAPAPRKKAHSSR